MFRFSDAVVSLQVDHKPVLWHTKTGRHLVLTESAQEALNDWHIGLPPPPDLKNVVQRLQELMMLPDQPAGLGALIPARSKLALLIPEGLWHADPMQPRTGGYAWRLLKLSEPEAAIWKASNGSRNCEQVAATVKIPVENVFSLMKRLTVPTVQAIQLRDRPITRRDPSLERILCPSGLSGVRTHDQYGPGGETTLDGWHHRIEMGERHFDDCETTVAHAFALPHPGLGGQAYGTRLFEAFSERGLLPPGGTIIEVGPGDGELGEAFLEAAQGQVGEYVRVDASPELLRVQRTRMPGTREILASATALPFADGSVSFLFSNEVLADLSAVPFDPDQPAARGDAGLEVAARLTRYRIKALEGKSFYNLGAWRMVEELARVLRPGGAAWLSEFGILEGAPEEASQLDHPEVSIQFSMLCQVARELNLSVQCEPLAEFLGFNMNALQLWRSSYEGLRALYKYLQPTKPTISARAWTPETLPLPTSVEGLSWVPLTERGAGPLVTRFWCVLLRKR